MEDPAATAAVGSPARAVIVDSQTSKTVLRPVGVKGFVILPKRWIVERTFAWLSMARRLSKDGERLPETTKTMTYIRMIHLMSRRLAKHKLSI